jgi:hypothetical protein
MMGSWGDHHICRRGYAFHLRGDAIPDDDGVHHDRGILLPCATHDDPFYGHDHNDDRGDDHGARQYDHNDPYSIPYLLSDLLPVNQCTPYFWLNPD